MSNTIRRRATRVAGTAAVAALVLAGCSGGGDDGGSGGGGEDGAQQLTVWTPHNTPARMAVQEDVAAAFTEETGIEVNVVGLGAADMNQSIVAGAAAGDMPDVAVVGPDQVASWSAQGLIDTAAAQAAVDSLDQSTFSEQALDLVTIDDELAAVPSDGWGELLYYRTDVFAELGLDAPESVQDVVEAAQAISDSDVGMAGIVLGTQPANAMAHENLEHFSLANGCQMFDESGEVALESDACVQTLTDFQDMVEASVPGDQDVESTRAAYLAGDAAMVMWSPHLLDEIAGLEPNFPVSADGVADDPQFLSKNTGIVGGLTGVANDDPTGFGLTMNLAVLQGADADAAQQYIEYVLSEGYIETLAMTPEGRAPVRTGTPENPTEYVDAWSELEIGVDEDNKLPFAEAYSAEAVEAVVAAANTFTRWGFGTENWATAGAAVTQTTLVNEFNQLTGGGDPAEYAAHIAEAVRTLQQENQ